MTNIWLSNKDIPCHDRLIVALDVPGRQQARAIVEQLGDAASFYKIGLELFMDEGYFDLLRWLQHLGKQVFVDLKFFDVPRTVQAAVRNLSGYGVQFATVHGNQSILEAAVAVKGQLKILAVTVLTSMDTHDMQDLGFDCEVAPLVLSRAKRALAVGCDGVISSGLEAPELRASLGQNFLVVCPGIRPVANTDDQKRTVDVQQAFCNGADYIVVGRPILEAPDPQAKARDIQREITKIFTQK